MENLAYSLNVVTPIFLLVIIGYILRRINWMSDRLADEGARLVFNLALPCSVFRSIMNSDISQTFNAKLVFTTVGAIVGIFAVLCLVVPKLMKSPSDAATIIQAIFRSNFLILGVPMARKMFGEAGMGPTTLLLAFAIPAFNVLAIVAFTLIANNDPSVGVGKRALNAFVGVLKNPLFVGAVLGIIFSLMHLKLPVFLDEAVGDIGAMATPLALLTMGAKFDISKFKASISVTLIAAFCRIIVCPFVVVGIGILLGFRGYELVALYVLFSAPTAVSSYVMAKNMGGNGNLASQVVLVTTFFAMFTITFGIFLLKTFALI